MRCPKTVLRNILRFPSSCAFQFTPLSPHPLPILRGWRPGAYVARPRSPPYSTKMPHNEEYLHIEYNWIDGAESLEKYCPAGFHPIMIGDVLHGRYRIVDKLGFGGFSTVWLALDTCMHRYIALKIGTANSSMQETNILRALASPGHDSIPTPLDEFKLNGPNGTHQCYTMIPARCNLREVSFSRLFPLEITRALSGNLILAIAYMHSRGYVHGGECC